MVSQGDPGVRRGIMHFHSRYSPDSITSIDTILKTARRLSLDFLILTDHDSIRGSLALAQRVKGLGLNLETPIAAEYKTDHGDLIAAFIEREIVGRQLDEFAAEVRAQNGLIFLPHPFVNHKNVERLAEIADVVEVFNGRADASTNEAAMELATRHGKPGFWASDAHLGVSLPRVVVAVNARETLKASLLQGGIRAERCEASGAYELIVSQVIQIVKQRDVMRALQAPWRVLRRILARFHQT
jgi:predicted metal-dependent phosphoesterase TrpH